MIYSHLWRMQRYLRVGGSRGKHFLGLILFFIVLGSAKASVEGQVVNWVKQAGGQFSDGGTAIVLDGADNGYVTGNFIGPATFGEAETAVTFSAAERGAFVAKYDKEGNLIWVKAATTPRSASGRTITLDLQKNVYVGGEFTGTLSIGEGENSVILYGEGESDTFLAKYDENGNLLWAIQTINTHWHNFDRLQGIAIDQAGHTFATGYFRGVTTFGAGDNAITLASKAFGDLYLAKYDVEGNLLWVKSAGGNFADSGNSVVVDAAGNAIVTGAFFSDSITFGEGGDAITLTGSQRGDGYVAKYTPDGRLIWVKQAGSVNAEHIVLDASGNSIITGFFRFTATFGEGDSLTTLESTNGSRDMFLAKYDSEGELLWVNSAGGTSSDGGEGIIVDANGSIHVLGKFIGPITIGQGEGAVPHPGFGFMDLLLMSYHSNGDLQSFNLASAADAIIGGGLALDSVGNRHVVGQFFGMASFGDSPDAITLTSTGSSDMFLAKFSDHLVIMIDIWPNRSPNVINLRSRSIPVAIYSTAGFDAAVDVDRNSLTFGVTGDEESLIYRGSPSSPSCQERDLNDDGLIDLRCFFATANTGFQPGDSEGILRGVTYNETQIEGSDQVEVTAGNR